MWGWLCVSLVSSATPAPSWAPTYIPSSDLPVSEREKPKRISFGGFYHHCSFREGPVTEGNCKDTFTLITYVFTELTKLPNQLLPCETGCEHVCTQLFSLQMLFSLCQRDGTAAALSFFYHLFYTLIESFSSVSFLLSTGKKRHF